MAVETSTILAIIAAIGCVGGIIARDRYIASMMVNGDKAVRDAMDKRIDVVHERVNKTRDEFVRREDLDGHLVRIEKTITSMHEEQKETNRRIDNFLAAIAQNTSHTS